ncbi:MAG TPA: FecR domain-containing protein [Anseongella sp.]|nr:FecR domain-containing protein [Anseongella sp.]
MEFEDDLNEKEIRDEWRRLQSAIEKKRAEPPKVIRMFSNWEKYAGIAASCALIALVTLLFTGRPSYTAYATGNAEQRPVRLPDGSLAVLNANSSIKFKSSWEKQGPREVEIDGEAFFSVVHTPDGREFFVRTGSGMQVEVLGTEFSVYERRGMQRVVLSSGSVRLQYAGLAGSEPMLMEPGEMISREGPMSKPERLKVDAARYSSWISGLLVFEDTPLFEVCRIMEDNFGVEVRLADTSLENRLFNGTFPADSAAVLLKALVTTYDLRAARPEGGVVELQKK